MKKNYDIVCIGMALVDSIIRGFDPTPVSASGYRAESGSLNVGGEAVNGAAAAAKLGMKTGILCSLGQDTAGDMVVSALASAGVDTGRILRSEDHGTPVTTMFVRADGSRRSITNTAHRYNFHPERYADRFTDARAVILGSLFRAPFDDPEIVLSVLKSAKAAGCLTVADTKLPNFRFLTLSDVSKALPYVDWITPNEDEAEYYTGKTAPEEMAEVFLAHGVRNVIIKLGAKGCYYRCCSTESAGISETPILSANAARAGMQNSPAAAKAEYLPPCRIEAVDATGAGDNFVAGFTAELLRGAAPAEAVRFANACGGICTTAVGAGTALRNREQVLEFLERQKNPFN